MTRQTAFAAVTLATLALMSCSDKDLGPEVTTFSAALSSANEVPTNTSTGTATASFSVVPGGMILYRLDITSPMDSITAAHIHAPAAAGTNAGVVVPLYGGPTTGLAFKGTLVAGVAPTPVGMTFDSLVVLLRNGNAYVNVHTRVHPAGEIRGQIATP
jgi:CHRD domain-containing protein